MDVNEELKVLVLKKIGGGGGGVGWRGVVQGEFERRFEVFCENAQKKSGGVGVWVGGGSGCGVWMDKWVSSQRGGVRVDVDEEVKFS